MNPSRPTVVVTHPILEPGPTLLREACELRVLPNQYRHSPEALIQAATGAQGMVTQLMDPIGEGVLATPGLKVVANVAVGYDNIDVAAATRHGVMVTNTPGILDDTTADFAFTLLMAAGRRLVEADRFVRSGAFQGWAIDMLLGHDISQATIGIVGFGRIGRGVARRARAFGMRVIYYDEQPATGEVEKEFAATRVDLYRLLSEADFVSVHVPLTDATRHMFSTEQFATMKPTAVLVNTSRGPVVDEIALAEALRTHQIFAAGLDVFEREPAVHPELLKLDNVVLAPHIASASVRTRSLMSEVAARNVITGVRGGRPPNVLNGEVFDRR
ncbi:MAG: D-glycerate dehydrogenase [Candidatus Dormibacteraeota bacterium]|nr:D-glycerate dehydrogenase [Candidatus Dormibacteraeota bacterium]